MRRDKVMADTPVVWPTSKCQRALRPLKLKIGALDRSLSASHSVTDGLTAWSSVISQRRAKQETTPDDSAAYRPPTQKLRKYGAARRQKQTTTRVPEESFSADSVLNTVRSNFNGAVGSAYVGVYYAFTAILEKTTMRRKFPSLATRAAYAVGQCVHLTGEAFTEEPVESDNWYDAVPMHCRPDVVIGHATQLVLSSAKTLQPILPAIALALRHSPLSMNVMAAILDMTDLTEMRKSEAQDLQVLATMINMPWALKIHFTHHFRLDFLSHASFTSLLDLKSTTRLDDSTQALCLKVTTTTLQYLKKRKELKTEADLRLYDILQAITFRVFGDAETWVLSLLHEAYSRVSSKIMLEQLSLAVSLAALLHNSDDSSLLEHVRELSSKILKTKGSQKQEYLRYLINAFPSDMLVKIVECLVGKVDDLAIALANMTAIAFEEDFVEWARTVENAVLCAGKTERYRFEPLLDSWIARTPCVSKRQHLSKLDYGSDTEEDDTSQDGYEADESRLQFSFVDPDPDDEDDLVKDFAKSAHKIPADVLNLLSVTKKSDVLASARLLKRFGRLTPEQVEDHSPLRAKQSSLRYSSEMSSATLLSPTSAKARKRGLQTEDYFVPDELFHVAKRTRTKRGTANPTEAKARVVTALPLRLTSKVQRELNNLRSGFSSRPSLRRLPRDNHRQATRQGKDSEEMVSADERDSVQVLTPHAKSDVDELSLL